ncbi:hypothetical protein SEA_ANON_21 [Gordonia phage Anon]|nr:hypothetical protein SEA_ANON_21 [Gordonia phage Anon]
MAIRLIGQTPMNYVVSHHREVQAAIRKEGRSVTRKAEVNLARARASTRWSKISGPDHLTTVAGEEADVDYLIHLRAPNAMAIEFGHSPSGFFAGTETKAPDGLYILIRAAGLAGAT